jgi:dolichyl-phosphate beta-glucosyltransferase
MNRKNIQLILSIIVSLSLLYFALDKFDASSTFSAIKGANLAYLLSACFLLILAYSLRGKRWMVWERNLTYWDSFKLILIGFMGNNIFPSRLGEILRAHCTAAKTSEQFGRTAALASIAVERILDGFIIALIGIGGLILVPISDHYLANGLTIVCILFFFFTCVLIAGIAFHEQIRRLLDRIATIFPGHLTRFGREKANYFLDGLLLIKGFSRFTKALLWTAIIWGIELLMYYFIANAVSSNISISVCLVFLAVVNFSSLFPLTAGGIGAIEVVTAMFLASIGIPASESLAMVLIQHGYQLLFTTGFGLIFYFTDGYYRLPLTQTKSLTEGSISTKSETDNATLPSAFSAIKEVSTALGIQPDNNRNVFLSIVIPAYNERSRLPKTVLETILWCNSHVPSYEIIIADDGSVDDTLEISNLMAQYDRNIKTVSCPHFGKGATVRMGMLNAYGKYVLFMDADGATPLSEIPKLMAKIDEGYPVAIGSRVVQAPGETSVKTSLHRKIIGRTFAALVNALAVSGIADTQCGFKMFRQDVVRPLFIRQKIKGFAFDVELLYLAKALSISVSEVPVNWVNQEGSKVNIITDSIRMFKDILKIRLLHANIEPAKEIDQSAK